MNTAYTFTTEYVYIKYHSTTLYCWWPESAGIMRHLCEDQTFWWPSIITKNPEFEWLHSSGYVTHGSRCRISASNRIYLLLATLLHPFAPCMTVTPLNFTAKVLGLLFALLQLLKDAADGWGLKRLKSSSKNFTNEWKSNFWLDLIPLDHDAVNLMAWNPVLVRIQVTNARKTFKRTSEFPAHTSGSTDGLTPDFKTTSGRIVTNRNIPSDHWESARAWNSLLDIFCLTPLSLLELCKHHWPPVTTTRLGIVELLQVKQRIAEVQNLWEMEVLRNGAVLNSVGLADQV